MGLGLVIGSLLYLLATGYWASPESTVDVSFRSLVVTVVPEAVIIVGSLLSGHHIGVAVIVAVFLCGVPEAFVANGVASDRRRVSSRTIVLVWAGAGAGMRNQRPDGLDRPPGSGTRADGGAGAGPGRRCRAHRADDGVVPRVASSPDHSRGLRR